jgi:O-antigen ligase
MECIMSRKNRANGRGKIKAKEVTSSITIVEKDWWQPFLLVLAGVLIFYPPLVKGLFFNSSMFISHIITAVVFSVVLLDRFKHKDFRVIKTPLDWAVLAYAGAYLLSLLGAVHLEEAIYGFLKALNYFMVYWIVTRVTSSYRQVRELLKYLLAGGLVVGMIGILAAAGYSHYPGAFVGGMIMSTLQYSNTMAAYLAVMILLGVTLIQQEKNIYLKFIYSMANYVMALAVLGSLSKGAWLILIGGVLLLLIGMPGIYRIKSIFFMGLTMGTALVIYRPFMAAISSTPSGGALIQAGIGVVLIVVGVLAWEALERILKKQRLAILIMAIIFLILLAGGIYVAGNQVLQSSNLIKEISTALDKGDSSYVTRLEFMHSATEIAKDHPVIGTGAGGWKALYRQYQDFNYSTSETHSHFFQVWVETGTIGLLAFLSMWIILFYYLYCLYKLNRKEEDPGKWILAWGIATGCLGLGAHAAIDFDLSIPAICMVLWSLLGLLNSLYYNEKAGGSEDTVERTSYDWIQVGIAALLALILLVGGSKYLYAANQAVQGKNTFSGAMEQSFIMEQEEGIKQSIQFYEQAVKYNPASGIYRGDLAAIQGTMFLLLKENKEEEAFVYRQESIAMMKAAAELRPYDNRLLSSLFRNAAVIGDMPGLMQYGQIMIKASPNDMQLYKNVAPIWWSASQTCEEHGQHDLALEFARLIVELEKDLRLQMNQVDTNHPLWQGERLHVTPEIKMISNQARSFIAADN